MDSSRLAELLRGWHYRAVIGSMLTARLPAALCSSREGGPGSLQHYRAGSFRDAAAPPGRPRVDRMLTSFAIKEKKRQKHFINLIPSENFTSQAVLDALGSVMQSTTGSSWLTLPFLVWGYPAADSFRQTSTRRATPELGTTEAMSLSTRPSVYARLVLSRPLASTLSCGVSMFSVSQRDLSRPSFCFIANMRRFQLCPAPRQTCMSTRL